MIISKSLHRFSVAQWPLWLAFLYTLINVLQLYKDRYLPKDSRQLDDFRFSVDRVECHFFSHLLYKFVTVIIAPCSKSAFDVAIHF